MEAPTAAASDDGAAPTAGAGACGAAATAQRKAVHANAVISGGSALSTSRTPAPFQIQPAPGSAGRSPGTPATHAIAVISGGSALSTSRTPAPFQPAPGSAGRSAGTPAPFQPAPGSTGRSPRNRAALSAKPVIVLVDWCLERVEGEEGKIRVAGTTHTPQMREGASSSKGNRKVPGRVFRSAAIVKRHDHINIEAEDGYRIQIGCTLNIPETCENGFSEEVCECFEFGFPIQWQSLVNPKMVTDNEHAQSPSETTASAPSHSVEYWMKKFLSDDFSSIGYAFTENDSYSSVGHSGSTDDNSGNIAALPEKPLIPPGEACNNSQGSDQHERGNDQHESMQIDACKLPTEGMTPKFGAIGGSEDSTGRRLRSGKVLRMPSGGPMKRGHEQKKIQQGFSAAEIVVEEKLESHDSRPKG